MGKRRRKAESRWETEPSCLPPGKKRPPPPTPRLSRQQPPGLSVVRRLTQGGAASGRVRLGHALSALQHRGQLRTRQLRAPFPAFRPRRSFPGCEWGGRLSAPRSKPPGLGEREWVPASRGSRWWRLRPRRRRRAQLHHGVAGPRQRRGDGAHLSGPGRAQVSGPVSPRDPHPLPAKGLLPARPEAPPGLRSASDRRVAVPPWQRRGRTRTGAGDAPPTPGGQRIAQALSSPE